MTRMTSFLIRLSVDMVSKLDLFILYIALNLLRLGVRLVASGLSPNGGRLRMKPSYLSLYDIMTHSHFDT
jgi:hypothetical protein